MIKKKIVLIGFILLFILFFNPVKAEIISSSSERTCSNGKCTQTIYASPRYEYDNNLKKWVNITDMIKMSFNYSTGDIKYSYSDDYYAIARLFFVVNVSQSICNNLGWNWNVVEGKCYLWWSQAKTFMESNGINYNVMITKDPTRYKYGLNLTSIPPAYADKILYVGMRLEETSGNINWDDVALDNGNVVIKNKVVLTYDDLIKSGYTLNLYDKRTVLIGNVTNKNNLWLDPITTIKANDTGSMGFKGTVASIPTSKGTGTQFASGEYTAIGADDGSYVFESTTSGTYTYFIFNFTLPNYTTATYMYVFWDGQTTLAGLNYAMYLYNFTGSTYKLVNSSVAVTTTDTPVTYNATSSDDLSAFLSGNGGEANMQLAWNRTPGLGYSHKSDYAYIQVSYTLNTAPSLENPIEPTDPSVYSSGANYKFNITVNDPDLVADISTVFFEFNSTGTSLSNNTATTFSDFNTTARNYSFTKTDLAVGTYTYKWYANDSQNAWASSSQYTFTINQASTSVSLFLNGTQGDKYYKNNSVANFTAKVNVLGLTVNLNGNYTYAFSPSSGTTSLTNLTTLTNTTNRVFNITGYFSGNANYTSSSQAYYAYLDVTTPSVYSIGINESYINANKTVKISVNTTDSFNISTVLAEVNTSSGSKNLTLALDATGNYTRNINKTDLGDSQANFTKINITKVYVNDTSNNQVTNVSTLQFYYGLTNHSSSQSVTEVYNAISDSVTWDAYYNEETTNNNITSGCTLTVFSNSYAMDYSDKYSRTISTYNLEGEYVWTINCTNSSYQSQSSQGTITVRSGATGGIETGGGGGGGTSYQIIQEAPKTVVVFGNASFSIVRPYSGESELVGIPGKRSSKECFDIKNTGSTNLTLDVGVIGDIKEWVTITTEKIVYLDPGETKPICYIVDFPTTQSTCLTPCQAFKIQLVDRESHLFVSFISKWSFLPTGGIRELLLSLSEKFTKIKYFGTSAERQIPIPMIILPFIIAIATGWTFYKFKFYYWSGLAGTMVFVIVLMFI